MRLSLKGNGRRSSLRAQAGWREKERTRTAAERLMGLHIKPLLFLWRCDVTKTRAAAIGHGKAMLWEYISRMLLQNMAVDSFGCEATKHTWLPMRWVSLTLEYLPESKERNRDELWLGIEEAEGGAAKEVQRLR